MPSYTVSILGQEVSFKTNVEEKRIKEAERLIQERFRELNIRGNRLNNEKILILLALSLADELIQSSQRLESIEKELNRMVDKLGEESC